MRNALLAFVVVVVGGVAVLLVVAASADERVAQTFGIVARRPVAFVEPDQEVCQQPLDLASDVEGFAFNPNSPTPRAPALTVVIRDFSTRRVLGFGRVASGWNSAKPQIARLNRSVPEGRRVAVCVHNSGRSVAAIFGDVSGNETCTLDRNDPNCKIGLATPTTTTSQAYLNGKRTHGDISGRLLRFRPRALPARASLIADRASIFRPGFVGPALWVLVLAGALLGVPTALVAALRSADR